MRTWRWVLGILAVAWVITVAAYAITLARSPDTPTAVPAPGAGQVSISINPVSFTPDSGALVVSMRIVADRAALDAQGGLVNPVGISVEPVVENGFVLIAKGTVPTTIQRTVQLSGTVRNYPFDRFSSPMVIAAAQSVNNAWQPLQVQGGFTQSLVSNWDLQATADTVNAADLALADDADTGQVLAAGSSALVLDTSLRRQTPNIGLSIVLLALMAALAVLALLGVRAVADGRRKQEMTMTSWFAALIFAMLPIRLALPGAPPMGAWIDILVTFWVFIVLMVALAWWIIVWLQGVQVKEKDGP